MLPTWLRSGFSRLTGSTGTAHSGHMVLWVLRGTFGAIIIGVATAALFYFDSLEQLAVGLEVFAGILLIGAFVVAADVLVRNKQITTVSAVVFGLLMGFLLSTCRWTSHKP